MMVCEYGVSARMIPARNAPRESENRWRSRETKPEEHQERHGDEDVVGAVLFAYRAKPEQCDLSPTECERAEIEKRRRPARGEHGDVDAAARARAASATRATR